MPTALVADFAAQVSGGRCRSEVERCRFPDLDGQDAVNDGRGCDARSTGPPALVVLDVLLQRLDQPRPAGAVFGYGQIPLGHGLRILRVPFKFQSTPGLYRADHRRAPSFDHDHRTCREPARRPSHRCSPPRRFRRASTRFNPSPRPTAPRVRSTPSPSPALRFTSGAFRAYASSRPPVGMLLHQEVTMNALLGPRNRSPPRACSSSLLTRTPRSASI